MSLVSVSRLLGRGAAPERDCDGCTVCCTVMAVAERNKPGGTRCDAVADAGCGIHPDRPAACRAFHCLWLRGGLADAAHRPDQLGVMFDGFIDRADGETRLVAIELWPGALGAPAVAPLLDALAARHPLHLHYRDGRRSVMSA